MYNLWSYLERHNGQWKDIVAPREGAGGHTLRTAGLIVLFVDQIVNGGLGQWYMNDPGQYAEDTISSIAMLGAEKSAVLSSKFLSVLGPHKRESQEERTAAVLLMESEHPGLESSLSDAVCNTFEELLSLAEQWLEQRSQAGLAHPD